MQQISSRLFRVAAVAAASLGLAACETSKPPQVGPAEVGFQCLPVPSEWNAPGSVIAVANGDILQIGKVEQIEVQVGKVAVPTYSTNSSIESGLVLRTLESFTVAKGWAANLAANTKGTVNMTTSYGGTTYQAVTLGQPEPIAIKWFKDKGYRVESGTKYYLVREAIQATEISYEVKRSDMTKLGGESTFKALEGKFNVVDRQANDAYRLNAKFTEPLNVCIKPRELVVTGSSANGQQYLEFRDPVDPVLPAR